MKILHVIHSLRNGGAERIVVDLAKGLSQRGLVTQVCTLLPVNKFENEIENHSLLTRADARFLPNVPKLHFQLKKYIRSFKPDIIHCHLKTDAAICGMVKDTPIVRSIQNSRPLETYSGLSFSNKILNWMERRSFFVSNMNIVACSQAAKGALQPYLFKHCGPTIKVIENGINLNRVKANIEKKKSGEACVIITVGTLWKDKNQKMSILAFKELLKIKPDCFLWILGDGVERSNLEKVASDLNIKERVRFYGYFENVSDYLIQGALYWSTAISEGFSIANLEAMSMGLPTIVTDVDGNKEMLAPWPNYRVQVGDYKKLAEVSATLLQNQSQMDLVGNEMKEYVFDKYNIDVMSEKYAQHYNTILNK